MILSSDENEKIMNLYLETPQMSLNIDDIEKGLTKERGDEISSTYKAVVYPFGRMFHIPDGDGHKSYNILDDENNTILYYKYRDVIPGQFIQTKLVKSDKSKPRSFETLFIRMILPTNKTISSDILLTEYGLKFWIKLFNTYKNLIFYVVDLNNDTVIRINDEQQFKDYYGPDIELQLCRYIVSTIERTDRELLYYSKI